MQKLSLAAFCLALFGHAGADKYPLVLIPGLLSSQLEIKVNKGYKTPSWICRGEYDWERAWVNVMDVLPFESECLQDQLKLHWDLETGNVSNTPFVESRSPHFGDTGGIESLDPEAPWPASDEVAVWKAVVDNLVDNHGYKRGHDVRGAPYDFRLSPAAARSEQEMDRIAKLIEDTVAEFGKKVVIVTHSLGGNVFLYIMRRRSQAWKDKHIQSWVSVATPFGGSVVALRSLVAGFNDGVITIPDGEFRHIERTWQSLWWLLPDQRVFGDKIVAHTDVGKNFSARDYGELFDALDYGNESRFHVGRIQSIQDPWTPVGVETHCLYSNGHDTVDHLSFGTDTDISNGIFPSLVWGKSGDGSVNFPSLKLCDQMEPVHTEFWHDVEHLAMIRDPRTVAYVASIADPDSGRQGADVVV